MDTTTLNVYSDNTVAYTTSKSDLSPKYWAWTRSGDEILALQIGERVYNTKDVSSVNFSRKVGSKVGNVSVQMRSGETFNVRLRAYPKASELAWLHCDTDKTCTNRVPFNIHNYNAMGNLLSGITDDDLQAILPWNSNPLQPSAYLVPTDEFWDPGRVIGAPVTNTVKFFDDAQQEKVSLLKKVDSQIQEAQHRGEVHRQDMVERQKEAVSAAQAVVATWAKEPIGEEDYCRTAFFDSSPKRSDDVVSDCQRHGRTSTGVFRKAGWVITSETPQTVNQLGVLHTMFDFRIRKVQ
ncbi:hypothetical protein BPA30113_00453 [Burkholderia paludis]|uniref:Uncharacterized protein n=2 Tax=Burkholderiaceae TaxID=119060 RepID=A0A6J5DA93_9BURK|nr:hypothetical protein LMG30113_01041 [Burkholderia paludis]VWB15924.1 hypothetical protein BPA30113_00453 [Burkholderia paludis]